MSERLVAGTLVQDRYRIVAHLGAGGMGQVYRAEDTTLGQEVALKFLPEEMAVHPELLEQFLGEVRIARQISHPGVCRVHDVGEADGRHFLSMEYVDGEDLRSLIRRIGRLPPNKAIEIAHQICAGLAAAHDGGILHRDLKPANVMLDGRGQARITDFGLAAFAADLSRADARVGTPAYMAPEQLRGHEVSVQSDLFSLGLVLFEVFTGRPAYEAKTFEDLVALHESSRPSVLEHVQDLDAAAAATIQRCLAKAPEDRPRSAREVSAGLPGGDPVAAALAAGETPSPDLIAASGGRGAVRPRVAAVLVGVVLACFAFMFYVDPQARAILLAEPAQSPEVSHFGSRAHAKILGVDFHDANYSGLHESVSSRVARLRGASKHEVLADPRAAVLRTWSRSSPQPLVSLLTSGRVSYSRPPLQRSGEWRMLQDSNGALVSFDARVRNDGAKRGAFDWAPVFEAAGLDFADFEATTSWVWTPDTACDQCFSWQRRGQLVVDGVETRVYGASLAGRPTGFRVAHVWKKPIFESSPPWLSLQSLAGTLVVLLAILALVSAVFIGRKNLKQGRGDRRGAIRLAIFFLAVGIVVWAFRADHVLSANEWAMFTRSAAQSLWLAMFAYFLYVAMEPTVRRNAPEILIGWSRALAGKWRDPMVARDVLVGIAAACVIVAIQRAHWLAASAVDGFPAWPVGSDELRYESTRDLFASLLGSYTDAITGALIGSFIVVLFTIWVRSRALALALLFAIGVIRVPIETMSTSFWLDLACHGVVVAVMLWAIARRGPLVVAVLIFVFGLGSNTAFTPALHEWYATPGLVAVIGVLLVATAAAVGATRGIDAPKPESLASAGS